jgi:hypothetical protein
VYSDIVILNCLKNLSSFSLNYLYEDTTPVQLPLHLFPKENRWKTLSKTSTPNCLVAQFTSWRVSEVNLVREMVVDYQTARRCLLR